MEQAASASQLVDLISQLRSEREKHVNAIARIDATFEQHGIVAEGGQRRGRRPGRPKGPSTAKAQVSVKRKRGTFRKTAEQFILGLLKKKAMITAEINKRWQQAGRGATANNTLSGMAKAGTIKRQNIKGARGSTYSAV